MRWSWRIGRVAGIAIELHLTFLLLLLWIAAAAYQRTGMAIGAAEAVALVLAIFASVLLHELGHALVARRFGVQTRGITLLPIGGVARLERLPDKPAQELAIAAAGPAVTIAIVVILYAVLRLLGMSTSAPSAGQADAGFLAQLLWINVALALFNLLPAFPMDGGRLLRAALSQRMGRVRATQIAAAVGKWFALVFGLVGLLVTNNPFLVVIALFIWIGASAEAVAVQMKSAIEGIPVSRVMATDVRTVSPDDSISVAIDLVRAGFQDDFPVVENQAVVGVLTRRRLLEEVAAGRPSARVGDVMQREFVVATADEPVERAVERLQSCKCHALPVVRGQELVGLMTLEKIGEFVALQSAAHAGASRR